MSWERKMRTTITPSLRRVSKSKITKRIATFLAVLLTIGGGISAYQHIDDPASAATLKRGDISAASSGGIVLDNNFHTRAPVWSDPSNISYTNYDEKGGTTEYYTYWYKMSVPKGQYVKLGKNITAKWTNCGFDNSNNRIDLVLTFMSDSRWWATTNGTYVSLLERYPNNQYNTAGYCLNRWV